MMMTLEREKQSAVRLVRRTTVQHTNHASVDYHDLLVTPNTKKNTINIFCLFLYSLQNCYSLLPERQMTMKLAQPLRYLTQFDLSSNGRLIVITNLILLTYEFCYQPQNDPTPTSQSDLPNKPDQNTNKQTVRYI